MSVTGHVLIGAPGAIASLDGIRVIPIENESATLVRTSQASHWVVVRREGQHEDASDMSDSVAGYLIAFFAGMSVAALVFLLV